MGTYVSLVFIWAFTSFWYLCCSIISATTRVSLSFLQHHAYKLAQVVSDFFAEATSSMSHTVNFLQSNMKRDVYVLTDLYAKSCCQVARSCFKGILRAHRHSLFSITIQMLAQPNLLKFLFAETARCERGVIAPSYTRCGDHRLSRGTFSLYRCQVEVEFLYVASLCPL